jgi:hypothetical protein
VKREELKSMWYWRGNKAWVEYSKAVCEKIEQAYINREKTVKVDDERQVDILNMIQYRIDDPNKQRYVKRRGDKPVLFVLHC